MKGGRATDASQAIPTGQLDLPKYGLVRLSPHNNLIRDGQQAQLLKQPSGNKWLAKDRGDMKEYYDLSYR